MPHWIKSLLGTLVAVVSGSAAVATALLGKPGDFDVDARLVLIALCCFLGVVAVVIWSLQSRAFWRGVLAITILYILAALAAFVVPRYHGLRMVRSIEPGNGSVGWIALWPPRSSAPNVEIELSVRDSEFDPAGFRVESHVQEPNGIEFVGITRTTATVKVENFHHPMDVAIGFRLKEGQARGVAIVAKVSDENVPVLQSRPPWRNPFLIGGLLWLIAVAVLFFLQ